MGIMPVKFTQIMYCKVHDRHSPTLRSSNALQMELPYSGALRIVTWTKLNFEYHGEFLVKPCQYEAIMPAVDLSRLGDHKRNSLLGHGTHLDVM